MTWLHIIAITSEPYNNFEEIKKKKQNALETLFVPVTLDFT